MTLHVSVYPLTVLNKEKCPGVLVDKGYVFWLFLMAGLEKGTYDKL